MGAPAGKVLTGWLCPVVLPSPPVPSGERSLPRFSEPRELRAQGSSFRVNIRPQRAADGVQDSVHLNLPAGRLRARPACASAVMNGLPGVGVDLTLFGVTAVRRGFRQGWGLRVKIPLGNLEIILRTNLKSQFS